MCTAVYLGIFGCLCIVYPHVSQYSCKSIYLISKSVRMWHFGLDCLIGLNHCIMQLYIRTKNIISFIQCLWFCTSVSVCMQCIWERIRFSLLIFVFLLILWSDFVGKFRCFCCIFYLFAIQDDGKQTILPSLISCCICHQRYAVCEWSECVCVIAFLRTWQSRTECTQFPLWKSLQL